MNGPLSKCAVIYNQDGTLKSVLCSAWPEKSTALTEVELLTAKVKRAEGDNALFAIVDVESMPASRSFRSAWRCDGHSVSVDMESARQIKQEAIDAKANRMISKLNEDKLQSDSMNDNQKSATIASNIKSFSQSIKSIDLTAIDTPQELEDYWPDELK